MPEQEWARSKEGMNPVEISISISMPEFDGIIHGVPVAAKHMKEMERWNIFLFQSVWLLWFPRQKMGVIAE